MLSLITSAARPPLRWNHVQARPGGDAFQGLISSEGQARKGREPSPAVVLLRLCVKPVHPRRGCSVVTREMTKGAPRTEVRGAPFREAVLPAHGVAQFAPPAVFRNPVDCAVALSVNAPFVRGVRYEVRFAVSVPPASVAAPV